MSITYVYHKAMFKTRPALLMLLLIPAFANADISVTTSIRPLELIARAVLGDRGSVTSLIDAGQSPHHYAMSPSDRLSIESADLLVWIGGNLEEQLSDVFTQQSSHKKVVTGLKLDSIDLLMLDTEQIDPHVWSDPRNGLEIARAIAAAAIEIDPENSHSYRANLKNFTEQVESFIANAGQRLSENSNKSYAVYHNAYQYFEKRLGLRHQLSLIESTEIQPGMREILATRQAIKDKAPICLFIEPDSSPALIRTVLAGYQLEIVTLDLLGYDVTSSANGYFELLENLTEEIVNCLN